VTNIPILDGEGFPVKETREITFALAADDFWQLDKYNLRHVQSRFRTELITRFFGIGFLVPAMLWIVTKDTDKLIVVGATVFLWLKVLPAMLLLRRYRMLSEGAKAVARVKGATIVVGPDGVRAKSGVADNLLPWATCRLVAQDAHYVYLFFNGDIANFVPKRAFPTVEAADEFHQTAVSYWKRSQRDISALG
jgi:hypothetical protein